MILSFLESWSRQSSRVYLLCGSISDCYLDDLRKAYPHVDIFTFDYETSSRRSVRIPQKMAFWEDLAGKIGDPDEDFFIFADIDTIARKDLSGIQVGDIVLTTRAPESHFFLNTGVVGLSRAALRSSFLPEWRRRTDEIIHSPALLKLATSRDQPYGAGDQMAVMQLVGPMTPSAGAHYHDLSVRTVPCHEFNACENVVDIEQARVLHLKTALQDFLLRRRPFIGERRHEDSLDQLRIALAENAKGLARLKGVPEKRKSRFRFRTPYLMSSDLSVPFMVRLAYRSAARATARVGRLKTMYRNIMPGTEGGEL